MKKSITALISIVVLAVLAGCATPGPGTERFRFSEESLARPEYNKDFWECDRIAKDNQNSVAGNAAGAAAVGAGLGALMGVALGFGVGDLAALGAMSGGLSGALGANAHNRHDYRSTFIQCMRDRGYQAY
jgi:outer membrane lipoprotein SlyB